MLDLIPGVVDLYINHSAKVINKARLTNGKSYWFSLQMAHGVKPPPEQGLIFVVTGEIKLVLIEG